MNTIDNINYEKLEKKDLELYWAGVHKSILVPIALFAPLSRQDPGARLRGAKRAMGTRMVRNLLAALGVGSTDFQPIYEPAFLAPYHDRWEEDKQPHSQNGRKWRLHRGSSWCAKIPSKNLTPDNHDWASYCIMHIFSKSKKITHKLW